MYQDNKSIHDLIVSEATIEIIESCRLYNCIISLTDKEKQKRSVTNDSLNSKPFSVRIPLKRDQNFETVW